MKSPNTRKEPWVQQAKAQADYQSKEHTEDCLDSNDDTSVLKGKCICPKASHTPGPWKVAEIPSYSLDGKSSTQATVKDSRGSSIAVIGNNKLADARLISAAPELLEAVKEMLDYVGEMPEGTLNRIAKTLAKAEGK